MTLLDKLNDKIITNINIVESENRMYYEYNHLELAEKCEKIADDYAIEFAEWVEKLRDSDIDSLDYAFWLDNTTKELLEIFKKEKNL
jgi:hypothetical protein